MNKQVITFKLPRTKHRAHRVLFEEDTPFMPKKVERKDLYKRKPKFVQKESNWF